eukprot:5328068-Amphidinium_carterae.1
MSGLVCGGWRLGVSHAQLLPLSLKVLQTSDQRMVDFCGALVRNLKLSAKELSIVDLSYAVEAIKRLAIERNPLHNQRA